MDVGLSVGLVAAKLKAGHSEERCLSWLLRMRDYGNLRDPAGLFISGLCRGWSPADYYLEKAKQLLARPVPDLGFGAALPEVPRETSMTEKKNAALEALRDGIEERKA
jgi:hypothetical protein